MMRPVGIRKLTPVDIPVQLRVPRAGGFKHETKGDVSGAHEQSKAPNEPPQHPQHHPCRRGARSRQIPQRVVILKLVLQLQAPHQLIRLVRAVLLDFL